MSLTRRFHLLWKVVPIVLVLVVLKIGVHALKFEFITIDGLVPSLVAGAIFLIGFLLSHVMAHYKEAERMPGDLRAALEAIHDDVASFARTTPGVDLAGMRKALTDIVRDLQAGLGLEGHHNDLLRAEAQVDALSPLFVRLEAQGMSGRYIARMRGAQDNLRRDVFRIAYIQKMQSVPSVHVLVETLVFACLALILFLKTSGSYEAFIILGFVSYLFIFALRLIQHLEEPFRTGEDTVDDVSLFLLRDFVTKLERLQEWQSEDAPGTEAEPALERRALP